MAKEYVERRQALPNQRDARLSRLDCLRLSARRLAGKHCRVISGSELEGGIRAIAFYLGHQSEIEAYLQEGEREFQTLRQQACPAPAASAAASDAPRASAPFSLGRPLAAPDISYANDIVKNGR